MIFDRFRLGGWAVSGLCLAVSTGLILNRHAALIAAARDESRASIDLEHAHADVAAVKHKSKDARFACAERTPDEETAFLMDLRRRAHNCGVSISRWNSRTTEIHHKEGEPDTSMVAAEGVTKVSCDLVLAGSYPALRTFLTDLWGNDRLLTVSHVDWARTDAGSELSMSLNRYLSPKSGDAKS